MTDSVTQIQGEAWQDVLVAVDRTYAELVDYQERLEAQNHELNTLRQFLSSVMASISDYLIVVDRAGVITEAGQATCSAVGKPLERLNELAASDIFRMGDGTDLETHLSYVISARRDVTIDAELYSGEMCEPVELRISPRLDRRRKAIGAVLTARPLGELRRAYAELEESHDQLKEAQVQLVRNEKLASLGRLLAGVAHELNNPISFVYANTHAMDRYIDRFETYFERVEKGASRSELVSLRAELKLDREILNLRSALEGARDGSKRVRDLVEDLRRLSADGSGEFEQFDLAETVKNAVDWVQRGTKHDMTIVQEGASRCLVVARLGHIQQVLLNLIQNASDATEDVPEAVLSLRFESDPDWVTLTLRDNGPGVPDDQIAAIFDPFFTTKEVGRGTGLGLSISHKIVQEHGGDLAYVEDGPGACFRLRLPASRTP